VRTAGGDALKHWQATLNFRRIAWSTASVVVDGNAADLPRGAPNTLRNSRGLEMDAHALGWIAVVLLIAVGVAGTILPALPGTILVLGGVVLGAWLDDFTRVKPWVVAIIAVLAVVAWVTDYVATVMGAKRVGASKWALIGAALGTIAGIFMGLVGVLFMPFVGAAIGEYIAQKDTRQAAKVGFATWIGLLVGTVVKLVLVFMMIGIFVVALLLS